MEGTTCVKGLKDRINRGELPLNPFPQRYTNKGFVDEVDAKYPFAERLTLVNYRNGANLQVFNIIDEDTCYPEILIVGDVPAHEDLQEQVEKLRDIEGCNIQEIHHHDSASDIHPFCYFKGKDAAQNVARVWGWANPNGGKPLKTPTNPYYEREVKRKVERTLNKIPFKEIRHKGDPSAIISKVF
jgi:hypothetical protein